MYIEFDSNVLWWRWSWTSDPPTSSSQELKVFFSTSSLCSVGIGNPGLHSCQARAVPIVVHPCPSYLWLFSVIFTLNFESKKMWFLSNWGWLLKSMECLWLKKNEFSFLFVFVEIMETEIETVGLNMISFSPAFLTCSWECYCCKHMVGEQSHEGQQWSSCGSPKASVGPFGRWETWQMRDRQIRHAEIEFGYRVCLVCYGGEREGGKGEKGK